MTRIQSYVTGGGVGCSSPSAFSIVSFIVRCLAAHIAFPLVCGPIVTVLIRANVRRRALSHRDKVTSREDDAPELMSAPPLVRFVVGAKIKETHRRGRGRSSPALRVPVRQKSQGRLARE
jgi:hypothetical protein